MGSGENRLLSLDFFRGIIMFLLVAEGTALWSVLVKEPVAGTFLEPFFQQFHHHPWNGLRFWDLVQPFFMFIVGVAMPFSYAKRRKRGDSKQKITRHIIQRCILLLAFGVGLHCGYRRELVWELWNVLSQLSVTIIIAYFLMRYKPSVQLVVSFGLLLLTEILYRTFPLDGYNQPFVKDHNFGSWMDMVLMGKINRGGGWVAINCIPTAAHTIWGVVVGKLLLSEKKASEKLKKLLVGGLVILAAGYLLHWTSVTPIIKRISTSSFVLASGGWSVLVLAFSYWFIDVKKINGWIFPFVIVGMNPIFIYLFSNTVGGQWFNGFVGIFINGFLGWFNAPGFLMALVTSLTVLALEWLLCYYLYRKRIFFKI
ncbi:Predicted acyltransferase [Mariniphaga anaerophila]|uniref:Predicted acyltransferase n=2 Tax=Mariniphaga anaerophila TaxID=1484053 RepID=A0A1M5CXG0_9BACT|nr:Predicted acyltransferase [Mariniphaga anaerophila]